MDNRNNKDKVAIVEKIREFYLHTDRISPVSSALEYSRVCELNRRSHLQSSTNLRKIAKQLKSFPRIYAINFRSRQKVYSGWNQWHNFPSIQIKNETILLVDPCFSKTTIGKEIFFLLDNKWTKAKKRHLKITETKNEQHGAFASNWAIFL